MLGLLGINENSSESLLRNWSKPFFWTLTKGSINLFGSINRSLPFKRFLHQNFLLGCEDSGSVLCQRDDVCHSQEGRILCPRTCDACGELTSFLYFSKQNDDLQACTGGLK